MRTMKQVMLGLVTAATGVLVACAYGMFYSWRGWVRDASTQQGIPGLRVSCILSDGSTAETTTTDSQGHYDLDWDGSCSQIRVEDVDGAANGTYDATTVELPTEGQTILLPPTP